jgi:hypothetical protein
MFGGGAILSSHCTEALPINSLLFVPTFVSFVALWFL